MVAPQRRSICGWGVEGSNCSGWPTRRGAGTGGSHPPHRPTPNKKRSGGSHDDVLDRRLSWRSSQIVALPAMQEWIAAAELEPDEIDELDAEF